MVARFRRPNARLDVELGSGPFYAGDTVDVEVSLASEEGIHARQGVLELVCTESYFSSYTSPQGGKGYQREEKVIWRQREPFLDNMDVKSGLPYLSQVSFTLPVQAPPTASGIVSPGIWKPWGISWSVGASVDIAKARDLRSKQKLEVEVLTRVGDAVGGVALPSSRVTTNAQFDDCKLSLTLHKLHARSGDTISGTLRAAANQDVKAAEARVELVRLEKAGDASKEKAEDKLVDKPVILKRGVVKEWPFELEVPQVNAPSLSTDHSSVVWIVRGTVDRRMRRDFRVENEVHVYTG